WEEGSQRTVSMRSKEGSSDYRYFPEPDLTPIQVSGETLEQWKSELPELPAQKRDRYETELGLSAYDTRVLTDDRSVAEYFEATVAGGANSKQAANWVMGDIAAYLNANKLSIADLAFKPASLAELVTLIESGELTGKIVKESLPKLLSGEISIDKLPRPIDSSALEPIIDEIIAANPKELEQYRNGKTKLLGFFVGQVMKKTEGRADPKLTNQLLAQKLNG
ncbi:MAG TPA: Asp-tRNA(Asn)/Glu-tRNA(Gln) amidotransferase GatCAB subunit B, partial [Cyanobacteria bacterium UBA11368]|nr:Asp-tRNA(Asn)/Glu-tRNA(Gln) amidotransferase GatCAB subunit B [Cyanobacteria bacterium UBA11368]